MNTGVLLREHLSKAKSIVNGELIDDGEVGEAVSTAAKIIMKDAALPSLSKLRRGVEQGGPFERFMIPASPITIAGKDSPGTETDHSRNWFQFRTHNAGVIFLSSHTKRDFE